MPYVWTAILWYDDIEPATHNETGLSQLLWQYIDMPRMRSLMGALLDLCDDIETMLIQLLTERSIFTATGSQLDAIGRIVGQLRGAFSDAEYRLLLLARIFVNRGDGTMAQFDQLLQLLGEDSYQLYEWWPAAMEASVAECTYGPVVGDLFYDLKPAGVRLLTTYSTYPEDELFTTADTLIADQLDTGRGFENLAGTTGGRLMNLRIAP